MYLYHAEYRFHIDEVADLSDDLFDLFEEIFIKAEEKSPGRLYNVVHLNPSKHEGKLFYYPHFDSAAHPFLAHSFELNGESIFKEYKRNPPVLHGLELILPARMGERINQIWKLVQQEQEAGILTNPKEYNFRTHWNRLCEESGLQDSLSPMG